MFRAIIAVFHWESYETQNPLCGQNAERLIIKLGGTYSNHWALKDYVRRNNPFFTWKKSIGLASRPEVELKYPECLFRKDTKLQAVWLFYVGVSTAKVVNY
jgi:hypothetical protein